MTFIKTNKLIISLSIALLAVLFVFLFGGGEVARGVEQTAGLSGWAWSDNIGWINLNNVVGDKDGVFSGWAWSDNIGWIKFNPAGPYPEAPDYSAKIVGDKIEGWIRACAGTVSGDCSGASRSDGWDGWIKLSGGNYGLTINSGNYQINGYAWGSDVIGWVDFSKSFYFSNFVPSAPKNVKIEPINHGFSITWEKPDFDGRRPPVSYKIYKGNSPSNLNMEVSTTDMKDGVTSFTDNRIQNTSDVLYYKVVAVNANGESEGVLVNNIGLKARNIIENMTIKGRGFLSNASYVITLKDAVTKDSLLDPAGLSTCSGFVYGTPNTLINGKCDITDAITGVFDISLKMIKADGRIITAELLSGFQVTYPKPVNAAVKISQLSAGTLIISFAQGDNLYTGAVVKLVVSEPKIEQTCFNLSDFNYETNQFPGGQCQINSELLNAIGGDYNKIGIIIANDPNSIGITPSRL